MRKNFYEDLHNQLATLEEKGTYKHLRYLTSPMAASSTVENFGESIVLCSNNYIGLANKPEVVKAAHDSLEKYGCGASSVRFICGTFEIHRELEQNIADFLGMESALTYTSCWAANTGAIPALLSDGDAVISDELNHASIIDGCRAVAKGVKRAVYKHANIADLEARLKECEDCGTVLIITDGVFSMEGDIAPLPEIIAVAKKYNALVMVDDSHATGVIGKTGRGTAEYHNITEGVDIISGTLGKALGGAGGGFIAASRDVCEMLIQKSRPNLFSNSLPPVLCAIGNAAINYLREHPEIVTTLKEKTEYTRQKIKAAGLKPLEGDSAIIPIILGETSKAIAASNEMMKQGIFTIGFGFPVVPEGHARIRLQISDALSYEDLDRALDVIINVMK